MLPVIEMFHSIQGEGKYTGVPSFFIRVSGCNLRCVFKGSMCDTPYSSFNPEKSKYDSMENLVTEFIKLSQQYPKTTHIVITGGEPMLYAKDIQEFLKTVHYRESQSEFSKNYAVTIETNGTLPALRAWESEETDEDGIHYIEYIDTYSISPKLSTSTDYKCKVIDKKTMERHEKTRINYDSLTSYIKYVKDVEDLVGDNFPDLQLKFVYSGEDSVAEIKDILAELIHNSGCDCDWLNSKVMLMPEAVTNDQLQAHQKECIDVCLKEGWRFCDRLHIRVWNDKRGV